MIELPALTLALVTALAVPAAAQELWSGAPPEGPAGTPGWTTYTGSICYLVNFEGNGTAPLSGPIAGTPISFGANWFTLEGSTAITNNPSGDTVAFIFGANTVEVTLSQAASRVSLHYASFVAVTSRWRLWTRPTG